MYFLLHVLNHLFFRLLHFSQATTVWDDLIDNLWRHVVAVGVVLAAVAVGFSRLVFSEMTLTIFFMGLSIPTTITTLKLTSVLSEAAHPSLPMPPIWSMSEGLACIRYCIQKSDYHADIHNS